MKFYHLDDICNRCGEYYGEHRSKDDACPIRDDIQPQRITGFYHNKIFSNWRDE